MSSSAASHDDNTAQNGSHDLHTVPVLENKNMGSERRSTRQYRWQSGILANRVLFVVWLMIGSCAAQKCIESQGLTDQGLQVLLSLEGHVDRCYLDKKCLWTIHYGHLVSNQQSAVPPDVCCSLQQLDGFALFKRDMRQKTNDLIRAICSRVPEQAVFMTDFQFDALLILHFRGDFKRGGFKRFETSIQAGYQHALANLRNATRDKDAPRGLKVRLEYVRDIWRGVYPETTVKSYGPRYIDQACKQCLGIVPGLKCPSPPACPTPAPTKQLTASPSEGPSREVQNPAPSPPKCKYGFWNPGWNVCCYEECVCCSERGTTIPNKACYDCSLMGGTSRIGSKACGGHYFSDWGELSRYYVVCWRNGCPGTECQLAAPDCADLPCGAVGYQLV